jgi:tail sheath protein
MTAPNFSTYVPPGVYTQSVPGPSVGISTLTPSAVGIFGVSVGFRNFTDVFVVPADAGGPTPVAFGPLTKLGANKNSIVITDVNTGQVYALTTDYLKVQNAGVDTVLDTNDDSFTFTRVLGGTLLAGSTVRITYQYTDASFFDATTFTDAFDLQDAYGAAFDSSGTLTSPLTLAGQLAFANGATEVVAVAVSYSGSPVLGDLQTALAKLQDIESIAIVVPATGDNTVFASVSSHVNLQSQNRRERRAIVGVDGHTTAVSSSTRIGYATAVHNRRVMMVSPSKINYFSTAANKEVTIGGYFMAAALAGISVSQGVAIPLTRKILTGFTDITEVLSQQTMNTEATNGLCVIEELRSGQIRIRHGVTTDPTSLYTREWTITGQEDRLAIQIRNYLDASGVIGSVISDTTLASVKAQVIGILGVLQDNGDIQAWRNIQTRQLIDRPDVIQVQFEWQASIPLNYILVRYSIDLTTGNITATTPNSTPTSPQG